MKNESPRLRADARHNREQIIEAARALIAERGVEVPMEEVARRAGVGAATLYRRFPDREALVRGVALDGFDRVVAIARDAEDEEPDAWGALARFVRRASAELRLATWLSIWFTSTWQQLRAEPEEQRLRQALLKILDRLVRRAQADGDLRPDVDAGDLTLMMALLLRPLPGLRAELTQRSVDRYLILMLEGLRAGPDIHDLPPAEIGLVDLGGS
ncbi:TetR/AcrR family transcriptional regulator [Micromonospora ureilytica]|uniref:AcrR family transcriptional regulator n=1 Tax=Micromonospora ureilytica TaxID=709868 RepID=A0ABS0JS75_9ACTN|nr:TetR/AcrR family transcriptional regulator [Micromonospora ureilytica]MBG6069876.1 AcrR family transcriptional regulator [Micromonospora ureilytica]